MFNSKYFVTCFSYLVFKIFQVCFWLWWYEILLFFCMACKYGQHHLKDSLLSHIIIPSLHVASSNVHLPFTGIFNSVGRLFILHQLHCSHCNFYSKFSYLWRWIHLLPPSILFFLISCTPPFSPQEGKDSAFSTDPIFGYPVPKPSQALTAVFHSKGPWPEFSCTPHC